MTEGCPVCGGVERKTLAPGFYECISQVLVNAVPPGVGGNGGIGPIPIYDLCRHRYQGTASPTMTETCECGMFAVGLCSRCGKARCGQHSGLLGQEFVCDVHLVQIAQEEAEMAAQAPREVAELERDLPWNHSSSGPIATEGAEFPLDRLRSNRELSPRESGMIGISLGLGATCPTCGGSDFRVIEPGYLECVGQRVVGMVPPWVTGGPPAREYAPCRHRLQLGTAPPCACGSCSTGRCSDCEKPVCGRHGGGKPVSICTGCAERRRERIRRAEGERIVAGRQRLQEIRQRLGEEEDPGEIVRLLAAAASGRSEREAPLGKVEIAARERLAVLEARERRKWFTFWLCIAVVSAVATVALYVVGNGRLALVGAAVVPLGFALFRLAVVGFDPPVRRGEDLYVTLVWGVMGLIAGFLIHVIAGVGT